MRKRIVGRNLRRQPPIRIADGGLTQIATVEVSSEDPQFPLESAFTGRGPDWQAGKMGEQRIR